MKAWTVCAIVLSTLAALPVHAAGITISDAKIAAGKLTVVGKSPGANQAVKLDNQFTTTSNAQGTFTFNVVYVPTDCIVRLVAGGAVKHAAIANCAVAPPRGADINGSVSLSGVPNGRCSQVSLGVAGAKAGDMALVATNAPIQNGVFLYASRVPSDGNVTVNVCNLSGTTMTAITDMPVRVITIP